VALQSRRPMHGLSQRERATLKGWAKWLVVLVLPFSALLFDTWLNVERLNRDFEIAALNGRLKQLGKRLDELRIDQARLERQARCELAAPDLGLVKPEPNQIEIVYYAASSESLTPEAPPYAVARLTYPRPRGSEATE